MSLFTSKFPCCSKVVSVGRVSAQQRWSCARPIGARAPTAPAAFLSSSSRWGWAEEPHRLWCTASSLWCCSRSWWRWRLQPSHDWLLYFSLPLADRQHAQRSHPLKPCVSSSPWSGIPSPGLLSGKWLPELPVPGLFSELNVPDFVYVRAWRVLILRGKERQSIPRVWPLDWTNL